MRAGANKKRLRVEEPLTTQNATGEEVTTWSEVATIYASIEPIRGREALLNGLNAAQMDTRIRFRWSPELDGMTSEWRLVYKQTVYDIVSPIHVGTAHREYEILAKSGTNLG